MAGVLAALLAAGFAFAPVAAAEDAPAAASPIDLVGVWHVLVHYTDDNSSHPEQLRWHDRLWVFEREHGKLVWTEYPIVVFGDDTDRFERRSSGQYARVLGGWWPSENQLANIRLGLRTNTRGMKSKKLRGSDAEGWSTASRPRAASASVITYQELWTIRFVNGLPRFEQEDVLGSARAETLKGVTRYEILEREPGGVLSGPYERDGTRHGRVWLRRAGGRLRLEDKDPSQQPAPVQRSPAADARRLPDGNAPN